MTLTLLLEGAGGRGCLRDTDNTTHETEGVSRAGALRSIRGRLDDVNAHVDQRKPKHHGQ